MTLKISLDLFLQDADAIRDLKALENQLPDRVLCKERDGATYALFFAHSVILPKNLVIGRAKGIDLEVSQAERIKFDFLRDRIDITDYMPGLKINKLRPLLKRAIEGAKIYNRGKIDESRKKYTPRIHASNWKQEGSLLIEAVELTYGREAIINAIYSRLSR